MNRDKFEPGDLALVARKAGHRVKDDAIGKIREVSSHPYIATGGDLNFWGEGTVVVTLGPMGTEDRHTNYSAPVACLIKISPDEQTLGSFDNVENWVPARCDKET